MIKTLILSSLLKFCFSGEVPLLVGSQKDTHNCVTDGGYSWCESSQRCVRQWEEPCPTFTDSMQNLVDVEFCSHSPIQMCRMACEIPQCQEGQCAVRNGNCCDYTCEDHSISCDVCPPIPPCPEPPPNCRYTPAVPDNCGCVNSCGTIDCSSSISREGETCGGFMPDGMSNTCVHGLECVNTMGPMIADAPGTCKRPCQTSRDFYGNCIEDGCISWNDGCNTCLIQNNIIQSCRQDNVCYSAGEAYCMDNDQTNYNQLSQIPWNCLTWYDGCNSCSVNNGQLQACTMMMCFTQAEPYCSTYSTGTLRQGDICYRFCEDGSQTTISRRDDCPKGTECIQESNPSLISFDTCSNNALRCVPTNGH